MDGGADGKFLLQASDRGLQLAQLISAVADDEFPFFRELFGCVCQLLLAMVLGRGQLCDLFLRRG